MPNTRADTNAAANATAAGNGATGNGAAGNGTTGNGAAGNGTTGNGAAGNGAAGNGTAGNGAASNLTTKCRLQVYENDKHVGLTIFESDLIFDATTVSLIEDVTPPEFGDHSPLSHFLGNKAKDCFDGSPMEKIRRCDLIIDGTYDYKFFNQDCDLLTNDADELIATFTKQGHVLFRMNLYSISDTSIPNSTDNIGKEIFG